MARVIKPGRTLAVLNIPLWSARYYQHLCKSLKYQAWIVWEALSFPVRMIMPSHYSILCFTKGASRMLPGLKNDENDIENDAIRVLKEWYCLRPNCISFRNRNGVIDREAISDLWWDIHRLKHNSQRVDHPCQLPPQLMRRLFALFTYPGETILDPFNGAGTSTLTAQQMGRKYIGVEISAQYHALSMKRHESLNQGIDPFGKIEDTPIAKNSRVQRMPRQKYDISKKTLQLDVKRITKALGHIPTKDEVKIHSRYPIEYFENYFVSWGEVCAAARTTGMSEMPDTQLNFDFHD